MPRFTGNLSDQQVDDIVKYVTTEIQHPRNTGGFGLGGLGPVAEGFVGLLIGVGFLALIGYWIGERRERRETPHAGLTARTLARRPASAARGEEPEQVERSSPYSSSSAC